MSDLPKKVAHYEILEKLGEGETGIVFKARCEQFGRVVALKLLAPPLTAERCARFFREALIMASLEELGAVPSMFEVGECEETKYLSREFIDGTTLESAATSGLMDLPAAIQVVRDLAHIVAEIHKRGIVHRRLYPSNVLLMPDRSVKLIGFGKARAIDDDMAEDGVRPHLDVEGLRRLLKWLSERIPGSATPPTDVATRLSDAQSAAAVAETLSAWLEAERKASRWLFWKSWGWFASAS